MSGCRDDTHLYAAVRQRGGAALGICIMEGRDAYIYFKLLYIIIYNNYI